MVLRYFKLNWAAEIKKLKTFNFGAAVSQNHASESVKQEQFHKSQVKSDSKKNFFLFFIFRLVALSWTCPYIYIYIVTINLSVNYTNCKYVNYYLQEIRKHASISKIFFDRKCFILKKKVFTIVHTNNYSTKEVKLHFITSRKIKYYM